MGKKKKKTIKWHSHPSFVPYHTRLSHPLTGRNFGIGFEEAREEAQAVSDGIALFSAHHRQWYPWYVRVWHWLFKRPQFSAEAMEERKLMHQEYDARVLGKFEEIETDCHGFMECDTCRVKAGSPYLCASCLHNRDLIHTLRSRLQN